jgi:trehalose synthase-fused probable maltokinase
MADRVQTESDQLRRLLDLEQLREWVARQRWYASKSRSVTAIEVVESIVLRDQPPLLLALVQARFATGAHELYQLPLGLSSDGQGAASAQITRSDGLTVYDALADPLQALELVRRIDASDEVQTPSGRFRFEHVHGVQRIGAGSAVRPIGVEQSNSSIVFDDRLVLKVFRKLEPGINPELELLRFLTSHGYQSIAPLDGWYEYDGQALSATLGVTQTFLPDAIGGWELALAQIESDPERLLARLENLGAVTAQLHNVLGSDASDPAFAPEEPSQQAMALLSATIDEDIERIFVRLPDDERLAPIAGRGQDVRERLATRAQIGIAGRVIRTHGDYHLGQTLLTPRGWVIIDFEGEPARPLSERRMKRSPLRDVASMLRSFAYATSALEILRGGHPPEQFEQRARECFLERYREEVDSALLPAGDAAVSNLLSIFELEKAIYELRYELEHRPEWISIPVAGIGRLLESG